MAKSYWKQMEDIVPGLNLKVPYTMYDLSAMWKSPDGTYERYSLADIRWRTGRKFPATIRQLLKDGNMQEQPRDGAAPFVIYANEAGVLERVYETSYKAEHCADLNETPKKPNGFKRFFRIFFKKENEDYERHQRRIKALKQEYAPEVKVPVQEKAPEVEEPEEPEVEGLEGTGLMAIADKEVRLQEYQKAIAGVSDKLKLQYDYSLEQVKGFNDNINYINKAEEKALPGADPNGGWSNNADWKKDKTKLKYAHKGLDSVLGSMEYGGYDITLTHPVDTQTEKYKMSTLVRLTDPTILIKAGMLVESRDKFPGNPFGRSELTPCDYLELVGTDVPEDKLCENYEKFCHAWNNVLYAENPENFQKDAELVRDVCQNAVERMNKVVAETGRETSKCHLNLDEAFVKSHPDCKIQESDMLATSQDAAAKVFTPAKVVEKLMRRLVQDRGQLDEKSTALYERAASLRNYAKREMISKNPYGAEKVSLKKDYDWNRRETEETTGTVQNCRAEAKKELTEIRQNAIDPEYIKACSNIPGAQRRLAHAAVTAKEPKLSRKNHEKMVEDLMKDKKFLRACNTEAKARKMLSNPPFVKVKAKPQKTVSKSADKGGF